MTIIPLRKSTRSIEQGRDVMETARIVHRIMDIVMEDGITDTTILKAVNLAETEAAEEWTDTFYPDLT